MKSDGLLGRNFLKGMVGDAVNAVLCGIGHNIRKILARLRALCTHIWQAVAQICALLPRGGAKWPLGYHPSGPLARLT